VNGSATRVMSPEHGDRFGCPEAQEGRVNLHRSRAERIGTDDLLASNVVRTNESSVWFRRRAYRGTPVVPMDA
jgi:hypothetical protein